MDAHSPTDSLAVHLSSSWGKAFTRFICYACLRPYWSASNRDTNVRQMAVILLLLNTAIAHVNLILILFIFLTCKLKFKLF